MASTECEHALDAGSLAPEHVISLDGVPDDYDVADFYGALLPGELVYEPGHECYLSLPFLNDRVFGQAFFSNYKLLFVIAKTHPSFAQFEKNEELLELLNRTTPIPLMAISSCKAVDDSALVQFSNRVVSGIASPTSFEVELSTKDVRRLRFQFDSHENRLNFLTQLNRRCFYGPSQLPVHSFAVQHYAAIYRAETPPKIVSSPSAPPRPPTDDTPGIPFASSSSSPLPLTDTASRPKSTSSTSWKYSMIEEFERLQSRPHADKFRLLDQGDAYATFKTYPRYFMVPANVDDDMMKTVSSYRSSQRVPAVVWIHPTNGTSLSRCSQPKSGFSTYSEADQNCVKSIWAANPAYVDTAVVPAEEGTTPPVMLILDARSRTAATANIVVGGGYEGAQEYGRCRLEFAGIANIHAVRESFLSLSFICSENKVTETVDINATQWYNHIRTILVATMAMVDAMENGASVMTHCSDGWDRTSQLSSLVQIILDPYFRTAQGFAKLIQKEWLSFGHKFCERFSFGEPVIPNSSGASPIFLQFIDSVAQIMSKYPSSFEFTEQFLLRIMDTVHGGRYGNFLANCEAAYLGTFEKTTASCWPALEAMWREGGSTLKNPGFSTQSGSIRLETVIPAISIWEAFFHRYNAQYLESLKQRRLRYFRANEAQLADALIQPLDGTSQSTELSLWRTVLTTAAKTDLVSSQVRMQIVYLNELFEQGCQECQVRLHFKGSELEQMVVQQHPSYRVQKLVPSLREATMELYHPNANSVHPPNGLVVLNTTAVTDPNGTKGIQSKVISSNYQYLVDTVSGWGKYLWESANAMYGAMPWKKSSSHDSSVSAPVTPVGMSETATPIESPSPSSSQVLPAQHHIHVNSLNISDPNDESFSMSSSQQAPQEDPPEEDDLDSPENPLSTSLDRSGADSSDFLSLSPPQDSTQSVITAP